MGIARQAVELGIKGIKEATPAIQKYVTETFGEAKQNLFSSMAKNNHPKYLEITQDLDTLTKSTDESVRETLGYNVHQKLDGVFAEGERLNTASTVTSMPQGTSVKTQVPTSESITGEVPVQPQNIDKVSEFGAASKIVTEPVGIMKAFPDDPKLAKEAETFVRKAYTYYNTTGQQSLKNYGRFVDPEGDLWYMKKQQGSGEAARFSLRKLSRKKAWQLTRYGRKAPDIEAIRQALKKHNAEHLVEDLLILRRKELKLKEAAIKKTGQSIGHLKSLAQKGIDVAENIADEAGKLNYARKHLKDLSDRELRELNVPITWEDYVNLKLPSLLNK